MGSFESSDASQVSEELSSGDELEDEVEVSRVLAKAFEVDLGDGGWKDYHEGMRQIPEDGVFVDHVVHLLQPDDFCLLQTLQSNVFVGLLIPCQLDSTEGA